MEIAPGSAGRPAGDAPTLVGERLARAFEALPDGVVVHAGDGMVTHCNSAAERILGLTRELMSGPTAEGTRFQAIREDGSPFPGDEHPAILALRTGEPQLRVVMGICKPDGSLTWVRVNATPFADVGAGASGCSVIASLVDITPEREDQERLAAHVREQEALRALATLIARQSTPEAVFTAAAEQAAAVLGADFGAVAQAHPSGGARLMGSWSVPALPAVPVGSMLHMDGPSAVAQTLRTGQIADLQSYDGPQEKRLFPTRSGLSAPIEVNGRLWGAVTVGWEHEGGAGPDARLRIGRIADLVSLSVAAAEARQQQARNAHASRIESLGQLAGGVAHDFNNLISVILNYAQFAADALPPDSPIDADLQEIVKAGKRAGELTQQLLTFGRHQSVERGPLCLNDVIRDLEYMLRRTLGEHIRVETSLDPGLMLILANRAELEQVLINLVVNARDAMPDGGRLTITTSHEIIDDTTAARDPGLTPGPYVRLEVTDDGVGMPATVRDRVFEPFFTTKPVGQGTGIGLATAHGIITQGHGTIALRSAPGQGTTCIIRLPGSPAQPPLAIPPGRALGSPGAGRGKRLLVVDDEDALRQATVRILAAAGYEVEQAAGADEALELVSARRFDLLLSDIVMPGMLGTELASRAAALCGGLHVIFMSGYLDPRLEVGEGAPARSEILGKPFTTGQLLETLDAAFAQTKA